LESLIEAFTAPMVQIMGLPVSIGDLLGFVSGLACVAFAAKAHILNFPFGLLNCSLLAVIFWKSRLFGDMALQGIFFVLTSIGWIQWLRNGSGGQQVPKPMRYPDFLWGVFLCVPLTLILREGLMRLGGAAPWPDAFITSASLWAQWLLNRKSLAAWPWWIAIDIVSIPLYVSRQIPLIALLYAVFLGLCIHGWFHWRRLIRP
jgi:nicotinamide mononucleotide transporter